jgi:hypothetical protein
MQPSHPKYLDLPSYSKRRFQARHANSITL